MDEKDKILKHLKEHFTKPPTTEDVRDKAVPEKSVDEVYDLLKEIEKEGLVRAEGKAASDINAVYWKTKED